MKRTKLWKSVVSVGLAVALLSPSTLAAGYTVEESFETYVAEAEALNAEILQEGAVLLKNEDGALPLAAGSKVTVLGAGSYNTFWGEASVNEEGDYCYVSDALTNAGFAVNPDTEAVYQANTTQVKIGGVNVSLDPDVSVLDGIRGGFASYGDAAIITLSRSCVEAFDLVNNREELDALGLGLNAEHQLALYENEKALVKLAKENFDKVIVLLNAANIMQIPELNEEGGAYEVDAILYIGLPGQYGLRNLGKLLNGEVSPSGRTADTWYSDFTKDPTYQNSCEKLDQIGEVYSVEYEEGIYLGYKYYETAYAEIAQGNYAPAGYTLSGGTDAEKAEDWYAQAVTYPFGYGLSYTTFSQELLTDTVDLSGLGLDDTIELQVQVTNTGAAAGKEVVQIYNHAPYSPGGIEKSEVTLAGFAKTGTLAPGESETVTISVRVGDLASYDWNDANGDGWYGYELEAGQYELRLQSDAHMLLQTLPFTLDETIVFANDGTLAEGSNTADDTVFSRGDDFDSLALASAANGGTFTVMSRADFAGTFPTAPAGSSYQNQIPSEYNSEFTPDMDQPEDPWYVDEEEIPADWTQGSGETSYTLYDMAGIDYTSDEVIADGIFAGKTGAEVWTEFLNQLTWDELTTLVNAGSFGTVALTSINKPAERDQNGPEQLGAEGTSWASANIMAGTFNTELLYQRGVAMGNEALYNGYHGWYGPTANLNRTPFGGRNHIYYSEDSLLAGKVSAALIQGAQSRGVIAYVKHFALNEQETERHGLATWLTEQALRETYLKAFEYAFKDGEALGVMQSLNKIGGVNGFGNYALDVTVLRKEWGFKGGVVTDAYNASLVRENMAQRMGGDIPLGNWKVAGDWDASANMVTYNGEASPTQWSVIRNSALHLLYMSANSMMTYNGYNMAAYTTQSVYPAGESKLTWTVGQEVTLDLGVDAVAFGGDNIVYRAENLPAGLTIDEKTGVITGTPTTESEKLTGDVMTVTLSATTSGEEWITGKLNIRVLVETEEPETNGSGSLNVGILIAIVAAVAVVASVVVIVVLRKKKTKQ